MKKSKTYLCSFLQPIKATCKEPYFSSSYEWLMELYGKRVLFGEINIQEYYSFTLDMYILAVTFNEYGAPFELKSWIQYLEKNVGHKFIESDKNYRDGLDKSFKPVVKYRYDIEEKNESDDFLYELDKFIKEST